MEALSIESRCGKLHVTFEADRATIARLRGFIEGREEGLGHFTVRNLVVIVSHPDAQVIIREGP